MASILILIALAGCDGGATSSGSSAAPASPSTQTTGGSPSSISATPPATTDASQFGDPGAGAESGPPHISLEKTAHEFGDMSETDTVTCSFPFTNTGGSALIFTEVKPTCTCTTVAVAKTAYMPGESGQFDVTFSPTAPGRQEKLIYVATNDEGRSKVTLRVTANVAAFVTLEPEHLKLGTLLPGQGKQAYLSVLSQDPSMVVRQVTSTSPHVKVRIVQASSAEASAPIVGAPGQALLEVTVDKDTPWGPLFGWVALQVEGTPPGKSERVAHTRQFRVEASIFGDLVADPDTFRAGARPGEAFTRTVRLKRLSGQPFRIVLATIDEMTVATLARATIQLNRTSESEYELVLNAAAGQTVDAFAAVVNIQTDVPGEEFIQIKISGRVIGPAG